MTSMCDNEGDGEVSVGRALSTNVAFSINHPLYQSLAERMEQRVAEISAAKGVARATATLSLVTLALNTDDLATLAGFFPEFRMANYGFMRPAHALFSQLRRLSAEWLLLQAKKLAESVVFIGTPLLAGLEAGFHELTMVVDPTSPVAVHERHAVSLDAFRVYGSYVEVSKNVGKTLSRVKYDNFLRGTGVRFLSRTEVLPSAQVLCVDGVLNSYTPWQVAVAMISCGAQVAFGFVPYHPEMLLNSEGEMPGFGVYYSRDDDAVRFKYPEGVAGVTSYSASGWRSWLTGHTFSLGVGAGKRFFQLELLKQRGCVMFYRMVALVGAPSASDLVHALEMPSAQPSYVVTSYRLKSLGLDPSLSASWVSTKYMVGQRLVDRVYQFAIQLPREQFTRYAIRKQLHVVNDRVTIEGTSVKVNSSLGEQIVDALVVDLFAKVFVDRYHAGTLTESARLFVDQIVAFPSLPLYAQLWFVVVSCSLDVWEVTLQPLNHYVRLAADAVRGFFSAGPKLKKPTIQVSPSYLLVGDNCKADLDLVGGALAAQELDRRAAMTSTGFWSSLVGELAKLQGPFVDAKHTGFKVENFALFTVGEAHGGNVEEVTQMMRALNTVDEAPYARKMLEVTSVTRCLEAERDIHYNPVADPVYVLNEFYSEVLPGVAEQELEFDTASISLDPQDRTLAAPYLRLPKYFGDAPRPREYYKSKLRALNVPKRQQTLQELLSSMAARNLNAPQIALPQDDSITALGVWENFLNTACHSGARDLLAKYKRDVVGLEEGAFREWATQSTPDKLASVRMELEKQSQSLGEMDVGDYLAMLKADVKPSLSKKPLDSRTEPQVIVYHEKALSALYSSIFRVLVRRFLALLKPNYHVNLLKDTKDMESFVRGVHPFGDLTVKYLENDFSKYDKSQGRFVFVLEELVFKELGMNEEFLQKWVGGHVECRIRCVAMGLSLHVLYQRKSGDATTSFGNVVLNVLSVSYAYRGTEVVWALFMGDDSVVCAKAVAHEDDAVAILAEVFNLGAKTYLTDSPYFASNFIIVDEFNRMVHFVPDPVKRIERWSMAVSATDPQWEERYISARDALGVYLNCAKTVLLPRLVAERYSVATGAVAGIADAIATVVNSKKEFRKMWDDVPTGSNY